MVLTCITVYKYRSEGLVRCSSNVGLTGSLSVTYIPLSVLHNQNSIHSRQQWELKFMNCCVFDLLYLTSL